jgi:hypothetical protein
MEGEARKCDIGSDEYQDCRRTAACDIETASRGSSSASLCLRVLVLVGLHSGVFSLRAEAREESLSPALAASHWPARLFLERQGVPALPFVVSERPVLDRACSLYTRLALQPPPLPPSVYSLTSRRLYSVHTSSTPLPPPTLTPSPPDSCNPPRHSQSHDARVDARNRIPRHFCRRRPYTHTTTHPYRIVCAHIPRSRRYCISPPPDDIVAITLAWSQHDAITISQSRTPTQSSANRALDQTRHTRPHIKTPRLHK